VPRAAAAWSSRARSASLARSSMRLVLAGREEMGVLLAMGLVVVKASLSALHDAVAPFGGAAPSGQPLLSETIDRLKFGVLVQRGGSDPGIGQGQGMGGLDLRDPIGAGFVIAQGEQGRCVEADPGCHGFSAASASRSAS
jgi:hypothetical protein